MAQVNIIQTVSFFRFCVLLSLHITSFPSWFGVKDWTRTIEQSWTDLWLCECLWYELAWSTGSSWISLYSLQFFLCLFIASFTRDKLQTSSTFTADTQQRLDSWKSSTHHEVFQSFGWEKDNRSLIRTLLLIDFYKRFLIFSMLKPLMDIIPKEVSFLSCL